MTEVQGEHRTIVMPRRRPATRDEVSVVAIAPRVGARIGRYRLCLELASGGMSTVYLARVQDGVGLHRFVALKCLKPQLAADPTFVEMFLDEAKLASMIRHPNVCEVIDYRIQDGVSYLAMEYLPGQSLSAVRRQLLTETEPLPIAQYVGIVARIVADAAEGLHAAHELTDARGESLAVVHRDVSPENVILTFDGNVKITDFGIAATSQQRHRTQPGTVKGKYAYIAPEVLKGQKPTRRADVWSLGVVAWEMLTGRRLFDGSSDVDVLRAVADGELPAPSTHRKGIPEELDAIVMRALLRDPAARYATARELARKLTCFLAEQRLAIGLAELSEFMDRLFPAGRACARQTLATVEQIEEAAGAIGDHDDRPTIARLIAAADDGSVSIPIYVDSDRSAKTRAAPAVIAPPPAPAAAAAARTATDLSSRRLAWTIGPPLVAMMILAAGISLRGCTPTGASSASAKPAEPTEPPAFGPGDTISLEPVELPSGEVVYRVKPSSPE